MAKALERTRVATKVPLDVSANRSFLSLRREFFGHGPAELFGGELAVVDRIDFRLGHGLSPPGDATLLLMVLIVSR